MNSEPGKLYVISAPSGAGKTTLVHEVVRRHPRLRFSVSVTTRPPRSGEIDGKDYFFVDAAEFDRMLADDEFLEHAEVFGYRYGTRHSQVQQLVEQGTDVLLEIDWQGARQVRQRMPECQTIFILPPSLEVLEQRLRGRSSDSEQVIRRRLGEAVGDISHWPEFDYALINDDLQSAADALEQIIIDRRGDGSDTRDPDLRQRIERQLGSGR